MECGCLNVYDTDCILHVIITSSCARSTRFAWQIYKRKKVVSTKFPAPVKLFKLIARCDGGCLALCKLCHVSEKSYLVLVQHAE